MGSSSFSIIDGPIFGGDIDIYELNSPKIDKKKAESTSDGTSTQRLVVVDIIRGFALMGLFLVHMMECYELYWANPVRAPAIDAVFLLFMGKSFSLLALCFGFSFFILMDKAARRGRDFTRRFAWRLLILAAIGSLHALLYRGDVIQILAALGFPLLIAHRIRSNWILIALALLCFLGPIHWAILLGAVSGASWAQHLLRPVSDPAMHVYLTGGPRELLTANLWLGQIPKWRFMLASGRLTQIMGFYLLGLVLGRIGFFGRLREFLVARRIAFGGAVSAALLLHLLHGTLASWFAGFRFGEVADQAFAALLGGWADLAGTLVWALALLGAFQGPFRRLILPLANVGRATLSLYIGQSMVFVPVFYAFGLGLYDVWSPVMRLVVGLAAVVAQLALAAWWFRHFNYGPLEWAWRALTYWRTDIAFRRIAREPSRVAHALSE